ncbi:hypothetical protein Jab_2c00940 [Janthinobacterium sp. HH01]|uniref:hypothetical protein n=1 Tax=Janthinobacterium sp. HH01 TaxID=1198452 RepID=UPI0002AE9C26|nr:hypothetical protein [Janthinobacterium sp. HH01]ELX08049.1 hypothetical protein Jab_2c00940 [Janthinobacterium sp. HH01]
MKYRDGIFATIALALTSVALAGVVYTDAYSQAASAEASGVRALTEAATGDTIACADTAMLSSASDTVQR